MSAILFATLVFEADQLYAINRRKLVKKPWTHQYVNRFVMIGIANMSKCLKFIDDLVLRCITAHSKSVLFKQIMQ